jgi:hypothetical protein
MKRARIFLASLTVVTALAGAFAFIAMKPTSFHTFYTTGLTTINGVTFTYCTAPLATTYTTVPNANPSVTRPWATTSLLTSVCPTTTVYPIQ